LAFSYEREEMSIFELVSEGREREEKSIENSLRGRRR